MKIFLIGYMGSGKSTVGRSLAALFGCGYSDMDIEIEKVAGLSVNQIFATLGEAKFRRMERELLERLATEDGDLIVSTGGGVPCHGDNMEVMNRVGTTVYLKMSPAKLVARLARGKDKRPIIKGMNDEQLLEFIEKNLALREPYYSRAQMVIDCDGVGDDYIVEHVRRLLEVENGVK